MPWIPSTPPSLATSGQYLAASHWVRLASAQLAHSWHSAKKSFKLDLSYLAVATWCVVAGEKRDDGGKASIVDVPPGFHVPPVQLVLVR